MKQDAIRTGSTAIRALRNKPVFMQLLACALGAALLILTGCKKDAADAATEAPPHGSGIIQDFDVTSFSVDHPEQFPLVTAVERRAPASLAVTGTVNPDIDRTVPVISLASGRVVGIFAKLGDSVKKGQVLLKVRSDDISGAFSTYQMAVADEVLAKAQLDRTKDLYEHGALALNDLQVAQDVEDKAKIVVQASEEHLHLLGSSTDHPSGIVDISAPVSGVITDQEVTNAAGVQSLGTSPFTISDLSSVWILCDVYENDLGSVHVGDPADVSLNAYPGRAFKGRVNNILPVLDPNIRTGKVRIEVPNPGLMKVGMFATATFRGRKDEIYTAVPASAVLHLHDRDYVYVPAPEKKFKRVEVQIGDTLSNDMQEIKAGIKPGQRMVSNALVLQNTVEQ